MALEEAASVVRELSTTSMATMTSAEFAAFYKENQVLHKDIEEETVRASVLPNAVQSESFKALQGVATQQSIIEASESQQLKAESAEIDEMMRAKILHSYRVPSEDWSRMTFGGVCSSDSFDSKAKKLDNFDSHKPVFAMKIERLQGQRYDMFSEDEEPFLRTMYTPHVKETENPKPIVTSEKIIYYDVRNGLPKDVNEESAPLKSEVPPFSPTPSRHGRASSVRSSARIRQLMSPRFDPNFNDFSPHQRDLWWVSYEELTPLEISIIKGLWKCITFDLWTFGALTTINLFKMRGWINDSNQKATPQTIVDCKVLWPHAKQAMEALELIVFNLHRPTISHKLVFDFGKIHGKLKIPITPDQTQLIINAFLSTFTQHVRNPKLTLKELNILRKFCNITMFLFVDASRWKSTPSIPF